MRVRRSSNRDAPHIQHTHTRERSYQVKLLDKPHTFKYDEVPVIEYIFDDGIAISGSDQQAMWGIAKDGKYYWEGFSKYNQRATTHSEFWDSFDDGFMLNIDDKPQVEFDQPVNLWFNLGLYWHWFCEDFPLLKFFRKNDYPILTNILHDWQIESLKFAPDLLERIYTVATPCVVSAPEYHCFTYPAVSMRGKSAEWVGEFLRDTITPTYDWKPCQRTYIGRGDAVARCVENEDEVKDLLSQYGFTIVDEMSQLTLQQKVDLFAKSKLVVSSTGANLTHCHAMQPNAKVIDFNHAFELTEECGWNNIGASVGVDWTTIPAQTSNEENDRSKAGGVKMKNRGLIVDIDLLRQAVEDALSEGTERS